MPALPTRPPGLLAPADKGSGSPPEVVADAVIRALSARRPKTRYVVGAGAGPLMALRWLASDPGFDRIMTFAGHLDGQTHRSKGSWKLITASCFECHATTSRPSPNHRPPVIPCKYQASESRQCFAA